MGWNVLREDMTLPLAVLKRRLSTTIAAGCASSSRRPERLGAARQNHDGPALFERQLADGAWGMTLATVQQVRVARGNGIGRIVLANQLVGRQAIDYIAAELARDPAFDFYCLVDSSTASASLPNAWRPTRPAGRCR